MKRVVQVVSTLLFVGLGSTEGGSESLLERVHQDDLTSVRALLASEPSCEFRNLRGVSALGLACENRNPEMVALLLKAGAEANADSLGEPVLAVAARTGSVECVDLLVRAGAEVNAKRGGHTALMWAAAEGHGAVVCELLAAGAEWKPVLNSGMDALMLAVRGGHSEAVLALLENGAEVNQVYTPKRPGGRNMRAKTSPLMLAVENGHLSLALLLLELGADPNDQRSDFAPLHAITWVRKTVLGDGPDGVPPPKLEQPIGTLGFVRALVEDYGAEVNLRRESGAGKEGGLTGRGMSPFMMAAHAGDLELLKVLLALGADPQLGNVDDCTPLLAAVGIGVGAPGEEQAREEEALAVAEYLLELGADINHVDQNGETVMHAAAYKAAPQIAKFLDAKGAKIEIWNRKNKWGWTPLLIAQGYRQGNFRPIEYMETAISEVMVSHGVEPLPAEEGRKRK